MDELWIPAAKKKARQERGRGWNMSEVPAEIWGEIGKRVESRLDVVRFRSVCRAWRSALPRPARFPLKVPPPPKCCIGRICEIAELTYYAVNQTVVAVEEVLKDGPFSSAAMVPEAQREEARLLLKPRSMQLSDFAFFSKAYHLHSMSFRDRNSVSKIVLISSSDANCLNPSYARLSDLTVVAHLTQTRKLAVLRLGGFQYYPFPSWNWEADFCTSSFEDIVNYRGRLYAVDTSGAAFVMDYHSLRMTRVAPALADDESNKQLHLMVSGSGHHLYLLGSRRLYRLGHNGWLPVDHELADHVFFIARDSNFPIPRGVFGDGNQVPRFCAWPDFVFQSLDEGVPTNPCIGFSGVDQPRVSPINPEEVYHHYKCKNLIEPNTTPDYISRGGFYRAVLAILSDD